MLLSVMVVAENEASAKAEFLARLHLYHRCEASGVQANLQVDQERVTCQALPPNIFRRKN